MTIPRPDAGLPEQAPPGFEYDAFISYRRKDGGDLAWWLRYRLLRYRLPAEVLATLRPEMRALHERRPRIWYDRDYEKPSDDFLTRKLYPALDASARLIVVATPSVAESIPGPDGEPQPNWMLHEIDHFLGPPHRASAERPVDVVLGPGLTSLEPIGRLAEKKRRDWADLSAFTRWRSLGLTGHLDDGLTMLVAGLYDVPGQQLPALRREEWRRRVRMLLIGGAVALAVAFGMGFLGVYAWWQRDLAIEREMTARIQLLAATGRRQTGQPTSLAEIERGAALAVESINLARQAGRAPEPDAVESIHAALSRLPLTVRQHGPEGVSALGLLSDGRLVSAAPDGSIRIWPSDGTTAPVAIESGRRGGRLAVIGGDLLATEGPDSIAVLDTDGRPAAPPLPSRGSVDLSAMRDGGLAAVDWAGRLVVWPKGLQGAPATIDAGPAVSTVLAMEDGRIATGATDGRIGIWQAGSSGPVRALDHGGSVLALSQLPDGRLVSGGDGFGFIKIWPNEAGEPLALLHGDVVLALAAFPDGRIASGGDDERILIWRTDRAAEPTVIENGAPVTSLAVLGDGRLASGGADGTVKIWPGDGRGEPVVLDHGSEAYALALLPSGAIAVGGKGPEVTVWPPGASRPAHRLPHHAGVRTLGVMPDGRLVSGSFDHHLRIWLPDLSGSLPPLRDGSDVRALAAAGPDHIVTGNFNGEIRLWALTAGAPQAEIGRLPAHTVVNRIVRLPDGRVAIGGDDGALWLWAGPDSGRAHAIDVGLNWIQAITVLDDGRILIGGTVHIGPTRSPRGKIVEMAESGATRTVATGPSPVQALATLADGRWASADGKGIIRIRTIDGSGEPVTFRHDAPVNRHDASMNDLLVTADGRLASAGDDGKVRIWTVDIDQLLQAVCLRVGRELDHEDWRHYVDPSDKPQSRSCRELSTNWLPAAE